MPLNEKENNLILGIIIAFLLNITLCSRVFASTSKQNLNIQKINLNDIVLNTNQESSLSDTIDKTVSNQLQKNKDKLSNISNVIENNTNCEENDNKKKNLHLKDETEKSEPDVKSGINKNLLLPTMSPGAYSTDMERTREYYNNLREFSPNSNENKNNNNVIIPEASLKLPPRTKKNAPAVLINNVTISKSAVFSDNELNKFKTLVDHKKVTAEDLNNLIYLIDKEYLKKNYITAKAYIPAATLKGGALHIELLEARIGKIIIKNNRFNRTFFLKAMLSQKEGDVLNIATLENDLRRFNRLSSGIKMTAKLKPGSKYGTTDVVLMADESNPVHLTPSLDDFGRTETGLMRFGTSLATDSLLGIQDRLTSSIDFTRGSITPFVDYNMPINKYGTRIGASFMHGNTNIISGDYQDFNINSKIDVYSAYITHPLIDNERFSLNAVASVNYKNALSTISDYEYTNMHDKSLSAGVSGKYLFKKGVLYFSHLITNGYIDNSINGNYDYFVKYNGTLFYVRYFENGIIFTARAGGQVMPENVPFIEQYQLGGISTVRGYSESLLLGQSAYFASLETLFPIPFLPKTVTLPITRKYKKTIKVRDNVKFATFFDNGAVFSPDEKVSNNNFLSSVGCGLRFALSQYLTARVYVGFGLRTIDNEPSARLHFDLISTPF